MRKQVRLALRDIGLWVACDAVSVSFTGKDYSALAIGEGGTASLEFVRVTFSDVSAEERASVRRHLEDYCQLDTLAMVWLADKLHDLAA